MAAQSEQLEPFGEAAENVSALPSKGKRFWRTWLLLTSSAALGGIAVAIWNRRSLARIRQEYESRSVQPGAYEDDVLS